MRDNYGVRVLGFHLHFVNRFRKNSIHCGQQIPPLVSPLNARTDSANVTQLQAPHSEHRLTALPQDQLLIFAIVKC
jgi:hypothetical protein